MSSYPELSSRALDGEVDELDSEAQHGQRSVV